MQINDLLIHMGIKMKDKEIKYLSNDERVYRAKAGEFVRDARKRMHLTVAALVDLVADKTHSTSFTLSTLIGVEHGRLWLRPKHAEAIADLLRLPVNALLRPQNLVIQTDERRKAYFEEAKTRGESLMTMRLEKGLTAKQLVDLARKIQPTGKFSVSSIYAYEHGRVRFSDENGKVFARALGIKESDLGLPQQPIIVNEERAMEHLDQFMLSYEVEAGLWGAFRVEHDLALLG